MKLLDYPVLSDASDDYKNAAFYFEMNEAERTVDDITCKITLCETTSQKLSERIENKEAQYAVLVRCPATRFRQIYYPTEIQNKEISVPLNVIGTHKMEISPYIITAKPNTVIQYDYTEHNKEFEDMTEMTLENGSILAEGNIISIDVEDTRQIQSAICIECDTSLEPNEIGLAWDHTNITILAGQTIYEKVMQWRKTSDNKMMVYTVVYLPIFVSLIEKIQNGEIEPDYDWYDVLVEQIDDQEKSLTNAQKILNMPLGMFVDWFESKHVPHNDDEEEGEDD